MKDFMTLLREAEVGVMSMWFFCTVCKKVRRGRTTCWRDQGQADGWGGGNEGGQLSTHLAGRTGRRRGLASGGLQLLILQLLLLVQLTHSLLVAALSPAGVQVAAAITGLTLGPPPQLQTQPTKNRPSGQNWAQTIALGLQRWGLPDQSGREATSPRSHDQEDTEGWGLGFGHSIPG